IPAWECGNPKSKTQNPKEGCGEIIVSEETPAKCPKCGGTNLIQDPDVLDTWFSSSLWPFSTLGWPDKTKDLEAYYPTTVLVTGYDIITFWVSKMIMIGLKFMKKEPFPKIFIHGLIRDITGKKMSKSLGNVIDPLNVIDRVGADALRFALISLISGQGQDIKLSEEKITEARNFSNKIWNAARYILGKRCETRDARCAFADKWILSRYNKTVDEITGKLDEFDLGEASRKLYDFIWSEFCDWYLEMSKIDASDKVLLEVFEGTLRLLHPLMPFITEEIWQKLEMRDAKCGTIMLARWPKADKKLISESIEEEMNIVKDIVRAIRNIRATLNIPHSKELAAYIVTKKKIGADQAGYIKALARLEKLEIASKISKKIEGSAAAALPAIDIYVPLKGIIDLAKEVERLKEKTIKLDVDIAQLKQRISAGKNIPENVMEEWKGREKEFLRQKETLEMQIKSLSA
ncbi:MAG: class I tRNA ligase family protein, partial [bacterium]